MTPSFSESSERFWRLADALKGAPPSEKGGAFEMLARHAANLVGPEFPRTEVADRLLALASANGLIETHGDDGIQEMLARAFAEPACDDNDGGLGSERQDRRLSVTRRWHSDLPNSMPNICAMSRYGDVGSGGMASVGGPTIHCMRLTWHVVVVERPLIHATSQKSRLHLRAPKPLLRSSASRDLIVGSPRLRINGTPIRGR